uniref:F-box domain-containing protein n=1 Tax=Leersia perrieri TaxID=77586 RepID=A0A0D9UZF1_9ORYZ
MDGIAAFPDDVLFEVLTRVGNIRDVLMLAVTCRRWLRRFTDPAFLRGLCPNPKGFFFQPTSSSARHAEPLASRRGIVLMQSRALDQPRPRPLQPYHRPTPRPTASAVLHPFPQQQPRQHRLRRGQLRHHHHRKTIFVLLLAASSSSPCNPTARCTSTRTPPPTMCTDLRLHVVGDAAVVHNGAAHWLCIDHELAKKLHCDDDYYLLYKLSAEVGTARVTLTKLHDVKAGGSPCLCVGRDGRLSDWSRRGSLCVDGDHQAAVGAGDDLEAWSGPRGATAAARGVERRRLGLCGATMACAG